MALNPLAGKKATAAILTDIPALRRAYWEIKTGLEPVAFGTSGHRGCSLKGSFNEAHILATTQAICEYRKAEGINGPLFLGKDSHALSEDAFQSALEVLAANSVEVRWEKGYTPTPAISHAILCANRNKSTGLADGIVITPSHNPPQDGGFKYNPVNGGPADTGITGWVENRANAIIAAGLKEVKRLPYAEALKAACVKEHDFLGNYVADLGSVIDMAAIAKAGVKIGVDPLGGAAVDYWPAIAKAYGLKLEVVNPVVDPAFAFMCVDHDGKIRMDCSSPYAMAGLVAMKDKFDIAFANDPDADRHGIVSRSHGLMNPNAYLAVAIQYLFSHRPLWPKSARIGKTLVSSAMIDRVASDIGREVCEVPVGFKWFVDGLVSGSLGFGGEESAGGSFLRKDGTVWTTDKDGLILCLLAAEIIAVTGKDPGQHYAELEQRHGVSYYARRDAACSATDKSKLKKLSPEKITAATLAGDAVTAKMSRAPGNNEEIGGVKVATARGWFAARPSGTEDVYKIYAESFVGPEHLARLQTEAQEIVDGALKG